MAQSVECPTLAWVMVSRFVSLSPTWGSLLSVPSLLQILCSPLSPPVPSLWVLSLSLKNIKKKKIQSFQHGVTKLQLKFLMRKHSTRQTFLF